MALTVPLRDIGTLDAADILGPQWFDIYEQIPDLTWPTSVQTYARMRHDPQLRAILAAYFLPIRRATWAVDPAGCRDEVVRVVADDLGLPILGEDAEPGPARRRGVTWGEHLRIALLSLVFGHMPFERRYEIRDGLARLVNLGERMPWTIGQINLNNDGTIASIEQDIIKSTPIPANRLLWYAHEREGATWTGRSVLRPAYGPWLLKHEIWRVHATSIRRFGMGIPSVEAPAGATPGQVAEAQRLASSMRAGDTAGAGLPNGFKLNITGMTGSVPDALAFIRYFDQQMSTSALTGLLDLGSTPNGSRALGDTFLDLFLLSLQAVADEIATVATAGQPGMTGAVTDLVDLNWGQDEPAPRVVCTDVGDRHEVTAEAITQLINAGAITPDEELEAYVRRTWRLPEKSASTPPAAQRPVAARRKARGREVRAAGDPAADHRQLTTVEAASGVDPDAIQGDWESALDSVISQWGAVAAGQQQELAAAIERAVDDNDPAVLGQLTVDSTQGAEVLTAAMVDLAAAAGQQMADEAASQGVQVEPPPVDEDRLGQIAAAVAAIVAAGLAAAAGREALRVWRPGEPGRPVAVRVRDHLESLSDAFLRDQLGGALTTAQNEGRFATLAAAPEAEYTASEVLDKGTCEPCLELDGTTFTDLAEARAAYASGGYVGCLGRLRCRGVIVALWNGDA
jgi:hypothetical protein